jgi:predicted RNA-binding Zn ribbon-like protein
MSRDPERAATQFFGGRVCLDFANTLDWRTSEEPQELIPSYEDFLAWSGRRGTLPRQSLSRLKQMSADNEAGKLEVMREVILFRRQIWKIADALRSGGRADISPVNRLIATLPPQPKLVGLGQTYVHDLEGKQLDEPLWPVLWSLTALIVSNDAKRIGCCNAHGCGWYFVDESPNGTRLWCSSEVCGNRERARRSYAKRRNKS